LITFETVTGAAATQSIYRMNGVLDAGQTVLSNLDNIMTCCESWMAYIAAKGQWSVVINKADAVSYAFDDDNIIGEIRVSATDITQSVNIIEAKFPDKGSRDQANFVNIATPSILRYPNEPDNKYSVTYDMCNDSVQAQYLANRVLEQAREDLIVSFSTTYYGIQVDAGSIVSVTNSDYGWTNKLFRVVKVNEASLPDGGLGAKLEMNEYSAAVYDDFNVKQYKPVPNSGLASPTFFSALSAPTVVGYPSATPAYFDVTVTIPTTGRVTNAQLFFTTNPTPTPTDWSLLAAATSSDTQPITNGSTYVFSNLMLSQDTYYFAFNVSNEVGKTALSPISTAFVWAPSSNPSLFVDISGVTTFTKTTANVYTPATATLTAITENVTAPTYAWAITGATPTTGAASSITITPNAAATSVVAQLTVNGTNLTAPVVKSVTMAINIQADKYATAYLYQWSTAIPGNPSGTSTYTWATGASSAYTGGNGWLVAPGSNPGTPLIRLYVASKEVVDISTDTTTSVSWTSGYSISDGSQNGANGIQTAEAIVYRWSLTAPTISGTSTYTWATGAVSSPPTGWFTTISDTGTANQTLWAAKVSLTDSVVNTTTSVNWATASIVPFGYVGTTGAVSKTAYTATNATLSSSPSVYIVVGDSLPEINSWNGTPIKTVKVATTANLASLSGLLTVDGVVLVAGDRVLVKNQTLSQNNGIYVAAATAWSRSVDANTWAEFIGLQVFVSNGTVNDLTYWQSNATAGGTLGTTPIAFTTLSITPIVWTLETPTLTTGQQVWQSDGVYNPTNDQTIWEVPYLSSLKVGNLAAISTNTGNLTVSGNFQANNAAISGTTMTGSGGILYPTGNFAFGNSTTNITYNGTALTLNGPVVAVDSLKSNTSGTFNTNGSFGLGVGSSIGGNQAAGAFSSSSFTLGGLLAANTAGGLAFGAGTTATDVNGSAVFAVGYGNSTFSTYRTRGLIGTGESAGIFQTGGANTIQTAVTAEIRLARYTGGVSYAYYILSGSAFPFTAGHDGLQLLTETLPEVGDIMVDVQLIAADSIENSITQMSPSSSANQVGAIGVFIGVSGAEFVPASLGMFVPDAQGALTDFVLKPEYANIYDTYRPIAVNAIGEGKINVCNQGGDIAIGDLLVCSDVLGKGMKQADDICRSYTVAKARENVTFTGPTDIRQIACIYMGG